MSEENPADIGGAHQKDAGQNHLLAAEPAGQEPDGQVADDSHAGGHHQAGGKTAPLHPPHLLRVPGEGGGDGVIGGKPQKHGRQQKQQAAQHRTGQLFLFSCLDRLLLRLGPGLGGLPGHPVLPDGEKKRHHRDDHDRRHRQEQGHVIGPARFGHEDADHHQRENAAQSAHQIDHGIGLAAQGLGRQVGHQGHGRRPVKAHGQQHRAQSDEKAGQAAGVIRDRQKDHADNGQHGSHQNKRRPPAQGRTQLVGQHAEQGQEHKGQHVVHRHDHAGPRFPQMKGVLENEGDNIVVHLPEGANGKECQAHKKGTPVIQFHILPPPSFLFNCSIPM